MKSLEDKYRKLGFKIGEGTRVNGKLDTHGGQISIGSYCVIGSDVYIITHCPIRSISTNLTVTIGNDVWIGFRALILPGVTIGNRVIVGANSVVTKDVASDKIVAGNPAKVIRDRDPYEIVRTHLLTSQKMSVTKKEPDWTKLSSSLIISIFELTKEEYVENYSYWKELFKSKIKLNCIGEKNE